MRLPKFLPVIGAILIANKTNTQTATTSLSNQCIITLFGQQYDVTQLRTTHSGGDSFVCGTDMTAAYQARHGTNMTRMTPYLMVTPTVTPSPTSQPTVTPQPTSTSIPTPTTTPRPTITPTPTVEPLPPSRGEDDENDGDDDEEEDEDKNERSRRENRRKKHNHFWQLFRERDSKNFFLTRYLFH